MIDRRILVCVAASIAGHFILAASLDQLPPSAVFTASRPIEIRVVSPPPPPAPEREPEPEPPKPAPEVKPLPKPTPTPVPRERPRTPPTRTAIQDVAPVDTPPVAHAPTTTDTTTTPRFGVTLESTSQGGRGPAVPVGNTLSPGAGSATSTGPVKPLAAPVV
ncbi:MAG: hypothetical protein NT062_27410, partial [Proteobacteria bacterium]|nr:hypothetical protein [Pseudomonadota bacterium]